MKKFFRKELLSLIAVSGAAVSSCSPAPSVDVYRILNRKCNAERISSADYSLNLKKQEKVIVQAEGFEPANFIRVNENNDVFIANSPFYLLSDDYIKGTYSKGRFLKTGDKEMPLDKDAKVIMDKSTNADGSVRLTFTMNCADDSVYAPAK